MKKMQIKILIITLIFVTLAEVFILLRIFNDVKPVILSEADYIFNEAVFKDYTERITEINQYYYEFRVSHDWPQAEISIATEGGTRSLTNIDSIRQLPETEKIRMINETFLLGEKPINPDTLNACFQKLLKKRDVSVLSNIRYTNLDKNQTLYSGTDSAFYVLAYPLKENKTGLFNEIAVQAYIKIPFTTVVEKAGMRFFIPFIIGGIILILSIFYYVYKSVKEKRVVSVVADANFSEETDLIAEYLKLDMDKYCLSYKGNKIQLTNNLAQLMELFLKSPEYFLTKEEIVKELWGRIEHHENRLSQTIRRLRSELSIVPEIKIENVRNAGFRLVIEQPVSEEIANDSQTIIDNSLSNGE